MSTVLDLKGIQEDGFEVQYEIIQMEESYHDERRRIINKNISELDKKLDVFQSRMDELNEEIDSLTNHADGLDYTIAVISGVIAGMVDSFFVGETNIDKGKIQEMLETKYHTANDSGYKHENKKGNGKWIDSALYHRLDDLAHHPTIVGLVASILVRYFRLVIFVDGSDGKPHVFFADTSKPAMLEKEKTELMKAWVGAIVGGICLWLASMAEKKYEEKNGEQMPEPLKKMVKAIGAAPMVIELFKAVDVWLGHMMSDVSTSQGIPGIFLSLMKELSVLPGLRNTDFPVYVDSIYNKGTKNLSEWGGVIFTAAKKQAIPVLINEVMVRGFYFARRLIYECKEKNGLVNAEWNKVIPFGNRTVERMMTIATGTFVAFDVVDAAIRSGGFNAACLLRVNFVGIGRFAIAIGTDVGMGIKKGRKEKERSELLTQIINTTQVKLYYKKADMLCSMSDMYAKEAEMYKAESDMWIAVKETQQSIDELYEQIGNVVNYYQEVTADMDERFDDIASMIPDIEEKNPGLIEEMLRRLSDE